MTIDIISSLACQFSCPEYLLSQYDRIPQKAIIFSIARFWLEFTYIIYAIYSPRKRGFGGWWCSKIYFSNFFCRERKNVKFGEKISLVFLFFVLCVSIKTLSSLFFSLFLLFVGGVFVSRVIIKKYSYKPFFTAATVSASKALISDNMAATLAVLASCMTAETILSPLEST